MARFDKPKEACQSFEEQEAYIASMKQRWDYKNSVDFAVQKEMQDVARNMLADKMPIENVAKYTRLSIEQVKALL